MTDRKYQYVPARGSAARAAWDRLGPKGREFCDRWTGGESAPLAEVPSDTRGLVLAALGYGPGHPLGLHEAWVN